MPSVAPSPATPPDTIEVNTTGKSWLAADARAPYPLPMTDSVPPVTFPTVVFEARPGVTGLVVPPDELAVLGAGKRPAVVVTVHGTGDAPTEPYTYRNTVGSMGGRSLVSLSA